MVIYISLERFCSGLSKLEGKNKVYGRKTSEGKRWIERGQRRGRRETTGKKKEESGVKDRAKKERSRKNNQQRED